MGVADMGRLHSKGKGISRSANPYKRSPPQWLKTSPLDVEEHVCKLAKKGLTPSQIGRFLRYPCRQVGDRVKNSAPPQEKWSCPGNSGGSIHVNQESGVCPQAHGAQSRRQRFKISPHPHRVAYPSPRALLSDHAQASCGLEV